MNGSREVQHPGTIVFVDGNTQQVTEEVAASEVPFEIAFVAVAGQYRPVVRVVAFSTPERRVIRQYGPDGELLNSTVQRREA